MTKPFKLAQQIYIERGRYCRRHAKVIGYPSLQQGFMFVRLYNAKGEISSKTDLIPISHARAVVEHSEWLA